MVEYQINSGNSEKPCFGSIPQLCPDDHRAYELNVKALLNLLSGDLKGIDIKSALPSKFALHQNFPNPFNSATTICYDLPEGADVTLKIYNIMGRHVTTLVDKKEAAGYKRVVWDGKSRYGGELSSGMYILQLIAEGTTKGTYTKAKKMLLVK